MAIKSLASLPAEIEVQPTPAVDTSPEDVLVALLDAYIALVPMPSDEQMAHLAASLCLDAAQTELFIATAREIFADQTGVAFDSGQASLLDDEDLNDLFTEADDPIDPALAEDMVVSSLDDEEEDDADDGLEDDPDAPPVNTVEDIDPNDFTLDASDLTDLRDAPSDPVSATAEQDFADKHYKNDGVLFTGISPVDHALRNDGEPEAVSIATDPAINDGEAV